MNEKKLARIAGLLYLIIIFCGIFSEGYVRMGLVTGDAQETASNIVNSQFLFRMGFVSDLVMVVADVAVAILFYVLLKPVSQVLALLAAAFRLGQASVIGINLLNHMSPLLLLGTDFQSSFSADQFNHMVLFFMESHRNGYLISQVFFSVNCAIMGYLLFRSDLFPKVLGGAIGLASVAYLMDALAHFLSPEMAPSLAPIMIVPVIAEFSFCIWLLAKGTK